MTSLKLRLDDVYHRICSRLCDKDLSLCTEHKFAVRVELNASACALSCQALIESIDNWCLEDLQGFPWKLYDLRGGVRVAFGVGEPQKEQYTYTFTFKPISLLDLVKGGAVR